MRRHCLVVTLLLASALAARPLTLEPVPTLPFLTADPPVPPCQQMAFTPPAEVPAELAEAAEALFAQGFPDPRGCDYREAVTSLHTHGWVLPGDGPQRFVIDWNGLIYPVNSLGPSASLSEDARALASVTKQPWPITALPLPPGLPATANPLAACLLLRAGQPQEATDVWRYWLEAYRLVSPSRRPLYVEAVATWLAGMHLRALNHITRGDDRGARADLMMLARALSPASREARRWLFGDAESDRPLPRDLGLGLRVDRELEALNASAALMSGPLPSQRGRSAFASQEAYVAALIDELCATRGTRVWPSRLRRADQAAGGDQRWIDLPAARALLLAGDSSTAALRRCQTGELRYTCVVAADGTPLTEGPPPLPGLTPLAQVASLLIEAQPDLPVGGFGGAEHKLDPTALARLSPPERNYRLLLDAVTRRPRDQQAAALVASIIRSGQWRPSPTPTPSPDELVSREVRALAGHCSSADGWLVTEATDILEALADTEDASHLDDLRWLTQQCSRLGGGVALVRICELRERLGDPGGLRDYATWLAHNRARSYRSAGWLTPLWRHPMRPEPQSAAIAAFERPDSPWNPAAAPLTADVGQIWQAPSGLLTVPAARRALIRALGNTTVAGRIFRRDMASSTFPSPLTLYTAAGNVEVAALWRQKFLDRPGRPNEFRVCDAYALFLSMTWGLPEIDLGWPVEQRDAAVRQCQWVLERYGQQFSLPPDERFAAGSVLAVPRLDRPATAADLAAGRALFTLGTERPVRRLELPGLPTPVWSGARQAWAWQAEERLENGAWRAYYGVVGDGCLGAVPADAVRFRAGDDGWQELADRPLAARLSPCPPAGVRLELRNLRAVPERIPAVWLRPTATGLGALRDGLAITLGGGPDNRSLLVAGGESRGFLDDGRTRLLRPGQSCEAGRLDLRRLADGLVPGVWRVWLTLDRATQLSCELSVSAADLSAPTRAR